MAEAPDPDLFPFDDDLEISGPQAKGDDSGRQRDGPEIPDVASLFSESEIETCLRVFQVYYDNPAYKRHATRSPKIKQLFDLALKALMPDDGEMRQRRKQDRRGRRQDDLNQLAVTGIRQMRKVKMVGYTGGCIDIPKPPRVGTVEANEVFSKEDDQRIANEVAQPALLEADDPKPQPELKKLNFKRSCHICGTTFDLLHHFYDQLCPSCADFNFSKRFSEADMAGRVSLVTGGRVKIGYAIVLKLLRMKSTVICCTRFPYDAARRFSKEDDFQEFQGRLTIYGIDFRDIPMVHHFTAHVKQNFARLDAIINNAAQTVRKPPGFYKHMMAGEVEPLEADILAVIDVVVAHRQPSGGCVFDFVGPKSKFRPVAGLLVSATPEGSDDAKAMLMPGSVSNVSAAMSQLAVIEGDGSSSSLSQFPPGLYDRDDQQIDLRTENSWTLELGEISTLEMIECHTINSFAPWVLISELRPLMRDTCVAGTNGAMEPCDKFIVNVSAMEGQFYRNKTIFHPHTNMAKASMNMMTRTAAAGFVADRIYMTAVDTGWITDENPVDQWEKRADQPPPLDEWDAAMRVIDPVLVGVRGEQLLWGVFLKNYRPTRW
ncbi:uncharacterized protein BJ171DRAFT_457130 [Polychytrium aggregatum]|uniref:uncharacterized protein n=1 Tax=Polychytrium aggregatum TaxID=110093 RepID=UPI0022FED876|nr:uncharacterized protein BJ171DRAFT_457130 [Polychytrium aggregatum]KAI9206672.1 hypothetical protein BJ171DRAFT_457130 [Polychytrium aggregatum]